MQAMVDRDILSRVLPFGVYIALMMATDLISESHLIQDTRWLYVIKVTAVATLLWYLRGNYKELYKPPRTDYLTWAIAVLGGAIVFYAWIHLNASWMEFGTSGNGFDPVDDGAFNWPLVICRVIGAALVVPIMEELFWRSFVMRWLTDKDFLSVSPRNIGWISILLSSLLFAIEHTLWFAGLFAGLVYALLYVRSGNIWVAILSHVVTNAMLGFWVIYTSSWAYW